MHLLWFPHCVIRALTNKSKKMREIILIKIRKEIWCVFVCACVWVCARLGVSLSSVTAAVSPSLISVIAICPDDCWLSQCAARLNGQYHKCARGNHFTRINTHIYNYFVLYAVCLSQHIWRIERDIHMLIAKLLLMRNF